MTIVEMSLLWIAVTQSLYVFFAATAYLARRRRAEAGKELLRDIEARQRIFGHSE